MGINNSSINYKGDIGFFFLTSHPLFKFRPGSYWMLNQQFIDDYQLIELGYGRILSRGKPYVKVEILKSHEELHFRKGKIVSIQPEMLQENNLLSQGYIRIISEELPAEEVVAEKDKVNARILKPIWGRSEREGSIIRISEKEASRLFRIEGENSIEILPENYSEPVIPVKVYKEADYLKVICKKSHFKYALTVGNTGIILKSELPPLLKDFYFDLSPEYSSKERAQILKELIFQKDPATNKIVRP